MNHQQYLNIKKILLDEYIKTGGQNPTEFLRGMTWFEGIVNNDDITVPQFEDVDTGRKIDMLQSRINHMHKEMDTVNNVIKQKDKLIKQLTIQNQKLEKQIHAYMRMSKKQRAAARKDTYISELLCECKRAQQSYNKLKNGFSPRTGD